MALPCTLLSPHPPALPGLTTNPTQFWLKGLKSLSHPPNPSSKPPKVSPAPCLFSFPEDLQTAGQTHCSPCDPSQGGLSSAWRCMWSVGMGSSCLLRCPAGNSRQSCSPVLTLPWHCQNHHLGCKCPTRGILIPARQAGSGEGSAAHGHSQTPCPVCRRSSTAPVAQDVMEIDLPNSSQPRAGFLQLGEVHLAGAGTARSSWSCS